jgi:hypothetical protein
MKRFQLFVIVLLGGCVAGLAYNAASIEYRVRVWESRVRSAKALADINEGILGAASYSRELMEAVRMLANENGILCEREAKTVKYVASIEDESARLKESLKESVEAIQAQTEKIDDLTTELATANFRVRVLETAMKSVDPSYVPISAEPVNSFLDTLKNIDVTAIIDFLLEGTNEPESK